jgi:hypothetical protein
MAGSVVAVVIQALTGVAAQRVSCVPVGP